MTHDIPKAGIFGNLDTATFAVEQSAAQIEAILASGDQRLRKEDIDRARKYLRLLRPNLRRIEVALKTFSEFAA